MCACVHVGMWATRTSSEHVTSVKAHANAGLFRYSVDNGANLVESVANIVTCVRKWIIKNTESFIHHLSLTHSSARHSFSHSPCPAVFSMTAVT